MEKGVAFSTTLTPRGSPALFFYSLTKSSVSTAHAMREVVDVCNRALQCSPVSWPSPSPADQCNPPIYERNQARTKGWRQPVAILGRKRHGNGETATTDAGAALFPGVGNCSHE